MHTHTHTSCYIECFLAHCFFCFHTRWALLSFCSPGFCLFPFTLCMHKPCVHCPSAHLRLQPLCYCCKFDQFWCLLIWSAPANLSCLQCLKTQQKLCVALRWKSAYSEWKIFSWQGCHLKFKERLRPNEMLLRYTFTLISANMSGSLWVS